MHQRVSITAKNEHDRNFAREVVIISDSLKLRIAGGLCMVMTWGNITSKGEVIAMVDRLAIFFGDLLMIGSIVSLIAAFTIGQPLFLTFTVFESFVHFIVGATLLGAGIMSPRTAQLFFRIFGVAAVVLGVMGVLMLAQGITIPGITIASPLTVTIYMVVGLISIGIGFSREVIDEIPVWQLQRSPS